MKKSNDRRVFNFSAGPSTLPTSILKKAQEELLSIQGSGMSVMEISHRSKVYEDINQKAEDGIRQQLKVPQDYAVLFLQGGASLQFTMVPMNFYVKGKPVDAIHTGLWTQKAIDELKKLTEYKIAASTESENFRRLPLLSEIKLNPDASYVHLASNNTVCGTQFKSFPDTGKVPIVADMSSDILSRSIDVSRFGLIFAGTQKNLAPPGLCLVIVKKEWANQAPSNLALMLQYRTHIKNKSLYNTPPTFTVYMLKLMMDWITEQGGLAVIEKRNEEKAKVLYDAIDQNDFYYCPIKKEDRSLMNVVFRIKGDKAQLEEKFAEDATQKGLTHLAGHRTVGGLRASIYNAQTIEGIKALVSFMKDFSKQNG